MLLPNFLFGIITISSTKNEKTQIVLNRKSLSGKIQNIQFRHLIALQTHQNVGQNKYMIFDAVPCKKAPCILVPYMEKNYYYKSAPCILEPNNIINL